MPPKLFMVTKAFSTEVKSAQNKLVSSANWLILTSFPNKLIPLTRLFCRILAAKISTPRTKRYGESGHPCLTPLEGLNHLVTKPLFKTAVSVFA